MTNNPEATWTTMEGIEIPDKVLWMLATCTTQEGVGSTLRDWFREIGLKEEGQRIVTPEGIYRHTRLMTPWQTDKRRID